MKNSHNNSSVCVTHGHTNSSASTAQQAAQGQGWINWR